MKKIIKSLLCIMAVLALCLTIAPTQVSMAAEVDYTKLTEEQLEAICFGTWETRFGNYVYSEAGIYEVDYEDEMKPWTYEGMVEFDKAVIDTETYLAYTDQKDWTGITNALKFTDGVKEYYLYYGLDAGMGESTLIRHDIDENGVSRINALVRRVNGDERLKFSEVIERLDEFMTEAPATEKVEEPATEDVTAEKPEETTTPEPSEEVTTTEKVEEPATTDNVDFIMEGEVEYTVKKGDCLWAIARQFYGNGKFYTHIFERNTDIIKKPELIHTGWKLIIPVLDK